MKKDADALNFLRMGTFVSRLDKLGIKVQLAANYPWVYLETINGKRVTEKYFGNHGFTVFILPCRMGSRVRVTDTRRVFSLIRKYIEKP